LTLISGPAGAGKSTLLRCIFDFLSPQLALDGRDVMFLPQRSYLPARSPSSLEAWEEFVLYPLLPENGDELMTVDRERLQRIFDQLSFSLPQSSQQKTDDYAAISIEQDDMTAEKFNSEDPRSTDPIYRLSPGERQKLALVAALFFQPNWLFMDEPFSSLDSPTITAVLSFLYASNTNCLIITHQPEIVETHWPGQWRQRIQLI
jgi:ABC-type multidrug transport system ATPase subunit